MEENSKVLSRNCLGRRTIAEYVLVYGASRGKKLPDNWKLSSSVTVVRKAASKA